ncbi:MAG: hypothetical protein ABSG43_12930 [Solirubrobacteraceae bacterium]
MNSMLNAPMATAHVAELRHSAERRGDGGLPTSAPVELRAAHARDAVALLRLAQLDDQPELQGRVLLASLDGQPVAALSLDDGRVVANPFVATGEAVALLRLRTRQLASARARRWRRIPRLRLA